MPTSTPTSLPLALADTQTLDRIAANVQSLALIVFFVFAITLFNIYELHRLHHKGVQTFIDAVTDDDDGPDDSTP